jgi:ADP-ribosylation factor-like protein 8
MGILFTKLYELFSTKNLDICVVGLENSGKTTLLYGLSLGKSVETLPTVGLDVKFMTKEGIKMKGKIHYASLKL